MKNEKVELDPKLPVFVAMSIGVWSKGNTITDALKRLVQFGGVKRSCIVWLYPPNSKPYVDGYGNVCHTTQKKRQEEKYAGFEVYRTAAKKKED